MSKRCCQVAPVVVLLCSGWAARCDEVAAAGRAVLAKHAGAIVTVRLAIREVFNMEDYGPEESEFVQEATGTIISPEGLVVMSLSSIDPSRLYADFFEEEDGVEIQTRIESITVLFEDGKETPFEVALRDMDLDLAFLRPTVAIANPLPYVDLTAAGTAEQFDELMLLHRLGKVAKRQCAGSFQRVKAILDKPRRLYILGEWPGIMLGAPALTLDGKCVGVVVLRSIKTASTGFGWTSDEDLNTASAVVPAEEVLEIAKQVPAVEPPASGEGVAPETAGESQTEARPQEE